MTAYTAIADSEIDPESPGTTTLFTKLRDNPIAISEGTSPAPSIQTAALISGERMNTTNVLNSTASAALGSVGTYAWLGEASSTTTAAGSTRAGSSLRYAGVFAVSAFSNSNPGSASTSGNGGTPSGTWRAMGYAYDNGTQYPATLWLRIS